MIQLIPPSIHLDGIIAQHAISEDPNWLGLHHNMATPHSDKPFPKLKIGLLNPNDMFSVSRTDQNNNTFQLNKLQITLEEAKTLGLSLLGLSETHHFKFPANVREFSSESEDSSVGGASLVILDETITVLPQNVIKDTILFLLL